MTEINIGTIIEKNFIANEDDGSLTFTYDEELYFNCAVWCNENNASIQEFEDRYEVVANPEPELADVKEAKIAEMKNIRDAREQSPLAYNNKEFDYDLKSVAKLNEARDILLIDSGEQAWITADSSIVMITAEDITELKRLGKVRSNDLHIKYAKLKIYIESLDNIKDVQAVTFDMELEDIILE